MEISRSTMLVYLPMWSHHGKAVVHFNIEEGTRVAYSRFVDDICQGNTLTWKVSVAKANSVFIFWSENCKGCLVWNMTWKLPALLNRPPPGYQPCSKIWKYLWMVFCHLGSLWLFPSLDEGSRYFIHRLTPLVITSIILSTHSFTTRSITLHFLSEMAYFLVFWYRNVLVFYMPSEFWYWVWMAIRASLMQIRALTMPCDFA